MCENFSNRSPFLTWSIVNFSEIFGSNSNSRWSVSSCGWIRSSDFVYFVIFSHWMQLLAELCCNIFSVEVYYNSLMCSSGTRISSISYLANHHNFNLVLFLAVKHLFNSLFKELYFWPWYLRLYSSHLLSSGACYIYAHYQSTQILCMFFKRHQSLVQTKIFQKSVICIFIFARLCSYT